MTYKDLFKKKTSDIQQQSSDKPANVNGPDETPPVQQSAPATKPATKH